MEQVISKSRFNVALDKYLSGRSSVDVVPNRVVRAVLHARQAQTNRKSIINRLPNDTVRGLEMMNADALTMFYDHIIESFAHRTLTRDAYHQLRKACKTPFDTERIENLFYGDTVPNAVAA